MQDLITYLASLNWQHIGLVLGSFLAAGGGLSTLIQLLKRLRKWESAAFIQLMVGVFSLLAALADYILTNNNSGLSNVFGSVWPSLIVAAMFMHRVAINPLTKLIEGQIMSTLKDAKAYRSEKASVAPPPPDQFN